MTDVRGEESNGSGDTKALPVGNAAADPLNLPTPLSSFVGRQRELAELRKALAGTRLLTLTGPGGCGKTRLGLQFATETIQSYPDGVWWVDLAPLAEERLVAATIAEALGVRPLPGLTELQAVCGYLASRRAMVVLDNCEHLIHACAKSAERLLQAAPEVAVLATSRAPLAVAGEIDWRVPPLSLPGEQGEGLADSDAVALFVERAGNVSPGFGLSEENVDSVARLCHELDGLPLAIELAAARLRMLSTEQISTGLSNRFRLLTGGPRTALERHQTLRASVDWSHELLAVEEQMLFRRLAVFAGGFTLEAVEQVCAGDGVDRDRVLDLLASLVDQSLVLAEDRDADMRYRLLEIVREYGGERLAEAGEQRTLRDRHCCHFLALAEQAGPHLETGRQGEWLEILDPEAANLGAAIDYALRSEPSLALRFCAALYRWWCARGRFAEAELAHASSLAATGNDEPGPRALVLHRRAWVATNAGEFEAAESHATEALALAEEVGDQATAARSRCELGRALMWADPRAGRAELKRAAGLALAAGDDWALVEAQQSLAETFLFLQDHEHAAQASGEVAELAERLGDPLQLARRWFHVAWMALADGPLDDVRDAAERMREAVHAVGEPLMEGLADFALGLLDVWEGESERALERLHRRLERALKLGAGFAVPHLLVAMAFAELAAGRPQEARDRLDGLLPLVEGRLSYVTSWGLCVLAEAQRLLSDYAADTTALEAQRSGEQLGNRLWATSARLTLGRLAAVDGEWAEAQQHALAHLDACAEGGHAIYVPACLDALGELAAGLGSDEDAVRLFAAAERARAEIGSVRVPPEAQHWAAIEAKLREKLGEETYEAAGGQGADLSLEDALEWARRARGPRRRPPGGWASLTPTESRVVELVAEGLTNPEIGERMFISKATVKTHLAHIFRKLDVHNRTELSARAVGRRKTAI
jgi:predicted ATPase/DNA-binding CsgD family transcriptional regulator